MMTIACDEAVQMLEAGWTVHYVSSQDAICWRSPEGISCDGFYSSSLDDPPRGAVEVARKKGHVVDRMRASLVIGTHFLNMKGGD